jgi:hypothetical protein
MLSTWALGEVVLPGASSFAKTTPPWLDQAIVGDQTNRLHLE